MGIPEDKIKVIQLHGDFQDHEGKPVRNLVAAVLERAILDISGSTMLGGDSSQKSQREARRWMASNKANHPFSFISCCLILDLDPVLIRHFTYNSKGPLLRTTGIMKVA